MCIGTAVTDAQAANGPASTTATLAGSSGGSTTAGTTSGSASGQGASSLSALTSITAPNAAVIGGFSTGQVCVAAGLWGCREVAMCALHGSFSSPPAFPPALTHNLQIHLAFITTLQASGADGAPTTGTSSTQLQATTPGHVAAGSLGATAASALGGPTTANTAGVASTSATGAQLTGSLLARTPTASQVADLLAAAHGDWASVIALLSGQASSGAGSSSATGSGMGQAVGSQPGTAVTTINSGSQAGGSQ